MVTTRDYKLTVMLSEDEERWLQEVAERNGLDASNWVRQAIRQAHAGQAAPPAISAAQLREQVKQKALNRTGKRK